MSEPYRLRSKSLINRHNPRNRIARANGFCKRRLIKSAASSQAVGLLTDNVKLYEEVPYIKLRSHPWETLKAKGSQRGTPLVGASVWAAKHENLSFTAVSLKLGLCLLET